MFDLGRLAALALLPALLGAADAAASTFETLYSFKGALDGGGAHGSPLIASDGKLYGTTDGGGGPKRFGTIYQLDLTTGAFATLYAFQDKADGQEPVGNLIEANGILFGTTFQGGTGGFGTFFGFDPTSKMLTVIRPFNDTVLGGHPTGRLAKIGSMIYGTNSVGGNVLRCNDPMIWGCGVAYSFDTSTGYRKVVHTFANAVDGANPYSGLTVDGSLLYGAANRGGKSGLGALFLLDPANGGVRVLHSFAATGDGATPYTAPVVVNGAVFGATAYGDSNQPCFSVSYRCGAIYRYDLGTGKLKNIHLFKGQADGSGPQGLVYAGGLLYGVTSLDGAFNGGTIFSIDPNTLAFKVVHAFRPATEGRAPVCCLVEHDGSLYGVTSAGGPQKTGTIFKFTP